MALMLAGLRGVDESLWMAARIDGILDLAHLPPHRDHRAASLRADYRSPPPSVVLLSR